MDQLLFFQKAVLQLSSGLERSTVFFNLFTMLKKHLPLDMALTLCYAPKYESFFLEKICTADGIESFTEYEATLHPDNMLRNSDWNNSGDILIINALSKHQLTHFMWPALVKHLGDCEKSAVLMPLFIEGKLNRVIGFAANQPGAYTQEHAALLDMLKVPLALSILNMQTYANTLALKNQLAEERLLLKQELWPKTPMVGMDSGLAEVTGAIQQLSRVNTPVLIRGETGVGKEVIARAIHESSSRHAGLLVRVDCGTLSDSSPDAELLGYEEGAVAGLGGSRKGRFELAHGGTIFLDEVGELQPHAQKSLLRILQNHEIERIGGLAPVPVDVRVIASTQRDLPAMVRTGQFREDLYFRLNVFPLSIPPLRDRKQDIPALVDYFLHKKSTIMKRQTTPTLAEQALMPLLTHAWPGNVRELENIVERALILHPEGPVSFEGILSSGTINPPCAPPRSLILHDVEREHIEYVLAITGRQISGDKGAAKLLGLHPNTLRKKMEKLGVPFKSHGKGTAQK